jgi:hypothetical protein
MATEINIARFASTGRSSLAIVILVPLGLCAIYWFAGPPPTTAYIGDDFALCDNAWRVVNGQHPSSDY